MGRANLYAFVLVLLFAFTAVGQEKPIDLNQADLAALCELPGIGPKKAKAILEYRSRRPFTRPSQLVNVKGIGRKTMKRLLPLIEVAPVVHHRMKQNRPAPH